jgi:hypothetical protein
MNRGRVGEERGGKETNGCPLTSPFNEVSMVRNCYRGFRIASFSIFTMSYFHTSHWYTFCQGTPALIAMLVKAV